MGDRFAKTHTFGYWIDFMYYFSNTIIWNKCFYFHSANESIKSKYKGFYKLKHTLAAQLVCCAFFFALIEGEFLILCY